MIKAIDCSKFEYDFSFKFYTTLLNSNASNDDHHILKFYPIDNSVELCSKDINKIILSRRVEEAIKLENLFCDNVITIFGRQMEIGNYADYYTKRLFQNIKSTLIVIKPSALNRLGDIVQKITDSNFTISRMAMSRLSKENLVKILQRQEDDELISNLVSNPVVILKLVGENAAVRFNNFLENFHSCDISTEEQIISLIKNDPDGSEIFKIEKSCFGNIKSEFNSNSTCCIIKPHVIQEGLLGLVLQTILYNGNFALANLCMIHLNQKTSEKFLEAYNGVVHDFQAFLCSFKEGSCVALEIVSISPDISYDVHAEFRKLCGPLDPEIAKQIRPTSLRALYGVEKYRNGVHCTDLKDGCHIEIDYIFNKL